MAVPANYNPIIDPAKKLMATPTPSMTPFYAIPEESNQLRKDMPEAPEGLPEMKPEDMQYFAKLLQVCARAGASLRTRVHAARCSTAQCSRCTHLRPLPAGCTRQEEDPSQGAVTRLRGRPSDKPRAR